MKNIFKNLFLVSLCLGLGLGSLVSYGSNIQASSKMNSYNVIIKKVNDEFGKEIIRIPVGDDLINLNLSEEDVYKKITSIPLDEFESYVRELCFLGDSIETDTHVQVSGVSQLKTQSKSIVMGENKVETGNGVVGENNNYIHPFYVMEDIE